VEPHLEHAAGFADVIEAEAQGQPAWSPLRAADLGSGGGLPGLPLALRFSETTWLLVESGQRRASFLRRAVARLDVGARVSVVEDRAEVVARSPDVRGQVDLVVARSFGPPAVVAECAAPLLRTGGRVVVSEPPEGAPGRWPADGLAEFGLVPHQAVPARGATYQVLDQRRPCPDRYPRRVGIPAKRPRF
jgi:16S rRNA (guanine527-N7)-methyltransferase